MNRTEFINFFKSPSGPENARIDLPPDTAKTAMAWPQFSQTTCEDLGSIYDYLETRSPPRSAGRFRFTSTSTSGNLLA